MNFDNFDLIAHKNGIIRLNEEELNFKFDFPSVFQKDTDMVTCFLSDENIRVWRNGNRVEYEKNDENYDRFLKPFVELFEAEKERQKPTVEELQARIQKQLTDAVQHVLDTKAQDLLYDNCLSVCSYIDTGVAKFDAEGKAFRAWRSAVWAKGYEILAQVQSGERAIPTEEELIAELPELVIVYEEVETPKSSLDYLNSLGQ